MRSSQDKFLIISINHSNAGFFAYLNFAINQLIYAEQYGLRPVVYFGHLSGNGANAFYDADRGENMWDYYFEPVAGLTYADIVARIADPDDPLTRDDLITLSTEELWRIHTCELASVYVYPHGIHLERYADRGGDAMWYSEQRKRANRIVQKYVRIKPNIVAKVDAFERDYFMGNRVIGVHLRGTDKGTAPLPPVLMRIIKPREYFPYIDEYTQQNGPCKIFVATDQTQFLDQMKARYGDRIISRETIRGCGLLNPFHSKGDGYLKGEEVLIDCLLLSRTHYLLKCTSAVGEFAMYFNPDLKVDDLNERTRASHVQLLIVKLRHKAWELYLRLARRI